LCPDELVEFVKVFDSHNSAQVWITQTFFSDVWFKKEHTLYSSVSVADAFSCTVYTFGDARFVVKEMVCLSPGDKNGSHRWFPELVNHQLAESLLPDHVLRMHAACMNRSQTHFYFVYDRAEELDGGSVSLDELYGLVLKLNELGLYHLDTKLANFLVRDDGKICLHDFGVALPLEMHACPGSLMFSDPFMRDRDLWNAVQSVGWDPNPFETIREWGRQVQARLLYALAPPDFKSAYPDLPRHTTGLGVDDLYESPRWFLQMFTVLNSFSASSVEYAWEDFCRKLLN
jgi:hypothetical protein